MKVYYVTEHGQVVHNCETLYEALVLIEALIKKATEAAKLQRCEKIIISPSEDN
jgi:hypothetical protein